MKKILILTVMAICLLTGCAVSSEHEAEEMKIAPEYDLLAYTAGQNTKYILEREGIEEDITDYVNGFENSHVLIDISYLKDKLGFAETKDENYEAQVLELIDEKGRLLQLIIGERIVFLDGEKNILSEPIKKEEKKVSLSEDIFFSFGYNEINRSRYKDEIKIELKK